MASANALLLSALLDYGIELDFFSKPTFVDPRPIVGEKQGFRFVPVVNRWSDSFRQRVEWMPGLGVVARINDAACYNRLLTTLIFREHSRRNYDAVLWMGDYAHGSVSGVPAISFAQGPPGSDAHSVLRRRNEIRQLAGRMSICKWTMLALLRLSKWGLPNFKHSEHIIVGSSQSRQRLEKQFGVSKSRISALPYAIDLDLFRPSLSGNCGAPKGMPLRVLWLGRIVPRKRLDIFLDGSAAAIESGTDVVLTIVGGIGFLKGYEELIRQFRYPERLQWIEKVPRAEVPDLFRTHDILAQPSEAEDFGSSVAEAQACGLPVIVGHTNGNADYLCSRDVQLSDDRIETFASALKEFASRKLEGRLGEFTESRKLAESRFGVDAVVMRLIAILRSVVSPAPEFSK